MLNSCIIFIFYMTERAEFEFQSGSFHSLTHKYVWERHESISRPPRNRLNDRIYLANIVALRNCYQNIHSRKRITLNFLNIFRVQIIHKGLIRRGKTKSFTQINKITAEKAMWFYRARGDYHGKKTNQCRRFTLSDDKKSLLHRIRKRLPKFLGRIMRKDGLEKLTFIWYTEVKCGSV